MNRQINVPQMLWSVFHIFTCFFPLGIASMMMTIMAAYATDDLAERKYLRIATIINIISTLLLLVCLFVCALAFCFFGFLAFTA